MHKMPAFIREAVALVVVAFYFLVLELQTQVSRFQRLLLLQHLKKSRRKRLILFQIALRKTRRARRALSWPRNQFWFETLLHGNLVDDWWKENFRISRRTFDYIVRVVGPEDTRLRECIPDVKYYATASGYICHLDLGYRPKPCLITGFKKMVSVGVYTRKIFT